MRHPTRQLKDRITGPLKKLLAVFLAGVVAVLLQACATTPAPSCEAGTLPAARCPAPGAVDDAFISELLDKRQWYSSRDLRELAIEPTETARTYETPIQNAVGKLLPPTDTGALDSLAEELGSVFEDLKARSYRWVSPEWLQMRKNLMELGGVKGQTLRRQRTIFKTLRATGLEWQF